MARSGSYDFNLITDEIVMGAFRKVKTFTPDLNALIYAKRSLNAMVKLWQAEGTYLWQIAEVTQTMTESTASYTLDTSIIGIEDGTFLRRDNHDTPLTRLTRQQYKELGAKATEGKSAQIWFDRQFTPTITVYPVPDNSTDVVHMQAVYKLQDLDGSENNPDFPEEWLDALIYGLAYRLAPESNLTRTEKLDLKRDAIEFKEIAKGGTMEQASLFIKPRLNH